MGSGKNKVLSYLDGEEGAEYTTVLGCLLRSIHRSLVNEIIVVTGYCGQEVEGAIAKEMEQVIEKPLTFIHNPNYKDGMAVSFAKGAGAISPNADAFLMFLGDQPLVKWKTIDSIIHRFIELRNNEPGTGVWDGLDDGDDDTENNDEGKVVIHPRYNGKKGHPVLFSNRLRSEVMALGPEDQPRYITWKYRKKADILDVDDRGICMDIDEVGDLREVRKLYLN